MPELVEKKDPPIIDKIKKINERFLGEFSKEIPILEILLAIERSKDPKLWLWLNNKKNNTINIIK